MFGTQGLYGKTILFCLVDGFNGSTFRQLSNCLGQQGATIQVASFNGEDGLNSSDGKINLISDLSFAEAAQRDFAAVVIADDVTANAVKRNPAVMKLVERTWSHGNSAVVSVGEGALVLIGAGIANNKYLAAPLQLANVLRDAGAKPSGTPIAISENIFSAELDADMNILCQDLINFLAQGGQMRKAA